MSEETNTFHLEDTSFGATRTLSYSFTVVPLGTEHRVYSLYALLFIAAICIHSLRTKALWKEKQF